MLAPLSRLTDRNWARRGKTERRSPPRSRSSRSLANEVGRNDHDDGGEVHDALIRDRQIQMDEKKEKPKLIASARESVERVILERSSIQNTIYPAITSSSPSLLV